MTKVEEDYRGTMGKQKVREKVAEYYWELMNSSV